jgi:hypothetical protein
MNNFSFFIARSKQRMDAQQKYQSFLFLLKDPVPVTQIISIIGFHRQISHNNNTLSTSSIIIPHIDVYVNWRVYTLITFDIIILCDLQREWQNLFSTNKTCVSLSIPP